jgi:hypothetical protein
VPTQAEEVPAAAATEEASIAPLPPVPVTAVVEGETAIETPASCAALVTPTKTGPSDEDTMVIVDEDSVILPSSGNRDAMIMETIASVSKALQEYECAGGFAPVIATDEEDVALAAPVAHVEPRKDVSALPQINEGREASPPPPRPVEAAEAPAPVVEVA